MLWVKHQVFQISVVTECSSYVFQIVRALEIIPLQKTFWAIGAFDAVAYLILCEVNSLQWKNRVIFVHPHIDPNDKRFGIWRQVADIVESYLFLDASPFLLRSCERASPLFGFWFFSADKHSLFVSRDLSSNRLFLFRRTVTELHDNFFSCWLGDVGYQMLDIKLVLIVLLLYLFFNFIQTSVVFVLQLLTVVAFLPEQTLFGRLVDLFNLFQSQFQGLYDSFAILDVLL